MRGRGVGLKTGWWVSPAVAALAVALDQLTKHLVVSNLELYDSWAPLPAIGRIIEIHYVTNTGAAFGLFQDGGVFFALVAIVVSAVIVFYHRSLPDGQWGVRLSLGLQLGGALGNLIDRLRLGHVIDFVDLHVWPVFNVADSAIVCGVILLSAWLLWEDWVERKSASIAEAPESASRRA